MLARVPERISLKCKDALASLVPKIPKSHQSQASDAVNSLLE